MSAGPKCRYHHVVKAGKVVDKQRWRRRGCGYQFTHTTPRGRPLWQKSLWVIYRTRKGRQLALTADPHPYDKPGRYGILVKVVDIFGNDTSQVYDVKV